MTTLTHLTTQAEQSVWQIPRLTHAEATRLAQTEYERTLAVLESLSGDDWAQPTYCTAWTVREMVAHLAGAVTGSTSVGEFVRQNLTNPYLKQVTDPVDAINKLQIEERAHRTPAELVAEFRTSGQAAVHNRDRLPWIVRKLPAPMGPTLGLKPLDYLFDTLYPRDQWMHRYDLCAATGKPMQVTPEHDGRIVALVLRDIARKLRRQLAHRSVMLHLRGALDGDFLFGRAAAVQCRVEMDVFDLNLRASGRIAVAEALTRTVIHGERAVADWFLNQMEVAY